MMLRAFVVLCLATSAEAWGKKKKERGEGAAGLMADLEAQDQMEQASVDALSGNARDYELDNIERHKRGELNTAELGLENMKKTMKDPAAMAELQKMLKDPEAMAQVRQMMAQPEFQAQAKAAMEAMVQQAGGAGGMADIARMMQDPAVQQQAKAMAEAMGMTGGTGGMDELARLRAENAALKARAGM